MFQFSIGCCCDLSGPFDFYFDTTRIGGSPAIVDTELFYRVPWLLPAGADPSYNSTDEGWQIDMNSEADAGLYEADPRLSLAPNTGDYDRVWSILSDVDDHPDSGASPDNIIEEWPGSGWTQSSFADVYLKDLRLNATDTNVDVTVYDPVSLTGANNYELVVRVTDKEVNWLRVHGSDGLDPAFSCYIRAEVTPPTIGTTANCTASVVDRGDGTYYVRILFTASGSSSGRINMTAVSADADTNYTGTEDDAITIHYVFLRKLTGGPNGDALSVVDARAESDLAFYMPLYSQFINDDPWGPLATYGSGGETGEYVVAQYAGFMNRHTLLQAVTHASAFGGVHNTEADLEGLRYHPKTYANHAGAKAQTSGTGAQFAGCLLIENDPVADAVQIEAVTVWNVNDATPPSDIWGFCSIQLWGETEWNVSQAGYGPLPRPVRDSGEGVIDVTYGTITHVPLYPVWIIPARSYPYVVTLQQPKGDKSHPAFTGFSDEFFTHNGGVFDVWFERSIDETVGVYIGQIVKTDQEFGIAFHVHDEFGDPTFDDDGVAIYDDFIAEFPMLSGTITDGTIFELNVVKDRLYHQQMGYGIASVGGLVEPPIPNCWCSAAFADIQRGDGSVLLGAAIVNYGKIDTIEYVDTNTILGSPYQWSDRGSVLPWGSWMSGYHDPHPFHDWPSESVTTKTYIQVIINGHVMLDEETWRDNDHGYTDLGGYGGYGWATGMHACKPPASDIPGSPPAYMFAWFEQRWETEPTAEAPGSPGPWRLHLTSSGGSDHWYLDSLPYDSGNPTPQPEIVASSDQGIYIKGFLLFDDRIPVLYDQRGRNWFLSYEKNDDGKPKYQAPEGQWSDEVPGMIDRNQSDVTTQAFHRWDTVKNSAQVRLSPRAADFGIRTTTLYVP